MDTHAFVPRLSDLAIRLTVNMPETCLGGENAAPIIETLQRSRVV
jgi:hypothetical protein